MTQPTPSTADPSVRTASVPTAPKQELSRSLKGRHLTMISIGGIIGAGLFVSSSTSIIAGGPASFISYAITGLLILLVMRMLGEMATSLPHVRSFTEFARAGLGRRGRLHRRLAVWYFWVLVVPVEGHRRSQDSAELAALLAPDDRPRPHVDHDLRESHVGPFLCGIRVLVRLHQGRRHHRVHRHRRFLCVRVDFAHGATFGNLVAHGGFTPHGWIAVLAAVPTVFFAMTGAEITTIAAAESAQPGRAVARMSTTVIWRILTFYVVSLFLIVSVVPWGYRAFGRIAVHPGIEHHAHTLGRNHHERHHSHRGPVLLEFGVLRESRVLFILAERGDAPQSLVKLNARKVPVGSVLIGAAAGFLGIIAATEARQQVFDFLVSSSGAVVVFVYMTICLAQIALRRARAREGLPKPAVSMWLFPYLSYATIAAMAGVLIAMAFTPGLQRDFYVSCITLAVAAAAYLIVRRVRQPRRAASALA